MSLQYDIDSDDYEYLQEVHLIDHCDQHREYDTYFNEDEIAYENE